MDLQHHHAEEPVATEVRLCAVSCNARDDPQTGRIGRLNIGERIATKETYEAKLPKRKNRERCPKTTTYPTMR